MRAWLNSWSVTAAALIGLGALWWVFGAPAGLAVTGGWVGAFAAGTAVGELLPLPRNGARGMPLSLAVLGAAALLGADPAVTAGLGVVGWLTRTVTTLVRDGTVRSFAAVPRILGGWAMAGAAAVGAAALPGLSVAPTSLPDVQAGIPIGSMVLVAVVVLVALPILDAAEISQRTEAGFRNRVDALLRDSWMSGAALAASAAVTALTYEVLGWSALLLVLLPLLAARAGLRRYVTIQRTYDETVRAMSRLPEETGTLPRSHGVRVAELALAAGRRLELDRAALDHLERAAHLHELGRVQLDPGEDAPDRDLARAGGGILRETGSLDDVATIVEQHRFCSVDATPRHALAADVLRLACDLDRGVVAGGDRVQETLSVLTRQVPHNPAVAGAMARSLHADRT